MHEYGSRLVGLGDSGQAAAVSECAPEGSRKAETVECWSVVRTLIGFVLLLAATAQAHALALGAIPPEGILSSHWISLAVLEFEAFVALWVLSGRHSQLARWVALGWFFVLALFSAHKALSGEESCRCFGLFDISPWYTLGINCAAIIALIRFCPPKPEIVASGLPPQKYRCGTSILSVAGALFGLYAASYPTFGSPITALAWIHGDGLVVDPAVIDLGTCQPRTKKRVELNISNLGDEPVAIVGAVSSCRCMTPEELPVTIPAGETRPVPIVVTVGGTGVRVRETVTLYGAGRLLQAVQAEIRGRVNHE